MLVSAITTLKKNVCLTNDMCINSFKG
jgi:hypothetical protein